MSMIIDNVVQPSLKIDEFDFRQDGKVYDSQGNFWGHIQFIEKRPRNVIYQEIRRQWKTWLES